MIDHIFAKYFFYYGAKMKQISLLTIFAVFALIFSFTPVSAASIPDAKKQEGLRMLEASGKIMTILGAQMDGDTALLEKTANEAVAIYDQILAENPVNVKALNARATVKDTVTKGAGDPDFNKAIEITSASVTTDDKNAEAFHDRAAAYRGLKKFDLARTDYQKAIALDPSKAHWVTELKAMEIDAK